MKINPNRKGRIMTRKHAAAAVAMGILLLAVWPGNLAAKDENTDPNEKTQAKQPIVEVCFVLDTTGSMGSLIEGAKAKIWSITNQIILGEPKPKVRLALVPYRDKGDAYVTKVFDLTDNIDQVYADLKKFSAAGGGDGPENVNQGLHDAINKVKWSKGKNVLRIIYLVGDFPPHNEYTDVPTYDKLAKAAITKGIYINTILCGNNTEAGKVWKEIARAAEGEFYAIGQSGDVQVIETPFDKKLAKLNSDLTGTAVVYGTTVQQAKAAELNTASGKMGGKSAPAGAERARNSLLTGRVATQDLVQAVADGKVDLKKLKKDQLPKEMRGMDLKEQKAYIAKQQAQRKQLLTEVRKLTEKRDDYIKAERAKLIKDGKAKKGFDEKVIEGLRKQAARKNIKYESKTESE